MAAVYRRLAHIAAAAINPTTALPTIAIPTYPSTKSASTHQKLRRSTYPSQHDLQSMPSRIKPAYSSAPYPIVNHYISSLQHNDPIYTVPTPNNTNTPFSVPATLYISLRHISPKTTKDEAGVSSGEGDGGRWSSGWNTG